MSEIDEIKMRYARRGYSVPKDRYSLLNERFLCSVHERQRTLVRLMLECKIAPLATKKIIEIGCGSGENLLDMLRLGAAAENLWGNELLEDRCMRARQLLPAKVHLLPGDATSLNLEEASFDIVFQSMVFSSILDNNFQQNLADSMWRWVRPGGGVLWYDFIYNNPNNPDVRGVSLDRIKELFPSSKIRIWRVTLAPPIARRIPPWLYTLINLSFLRTHVLCYIEKV